MTTLSLTPFHAALLVAAAVTLGAILGYAIRAWTEPRRQRRRSVSEEALRSETRRVVTPLGGEGATADPWRGERSKDVASSEWSQSAPDRPTVLVVDDRLELRAIHSTYLEQHGYHVLKAADGETALALAREHHPAVVVLDHSLPGRTGIEVTRELKRDPRTSRIPVILMTAHSYGAIGMAAKEAGVAAFLPKPVDPSRVLREVARHTRVDIHDA